MCVYFYIHNKYTQYTHILQKIFHFGCKYMLPGTSNIICFWLYTVFNINEGKLAGGSFNTLKGSLYFYEFVSLTLLMEGNYPNWSFFSFRSVNCLWLRFDICLVLKIGTSKSHLWKLLRVEITSEQICFADDWCLHGLVNMHLFTESRQTL